MIQTSLRPLDSPAHSEPEGWAAIQNSLTSHRDEPTGAFRNSTAREGKPCTWAGITPGYCTGCRCAKREVGLKVQQAEQEPGLHRQHTQGWIPLLSAQQIHPRALHSVWDSSHGAQQLCWFCRPSRLSESGAIALERMGCEKGAYPVWQTQGFANPASTTHRKVTEHRAKLFTAVRCARAKDTRHSLKQEGLRLHTRPSTFTMGTIKPQGRLPRQAGQSLTLEVFKTSPDSALSNLL